MFGNTAKRTISTLADQAASLVGIDPKDVWRQTHQREYAWTRFAIMSEARRRGITYSRIARELRMDHTSIIHGVRRADEIAAVDTDMCDLLAALRAVQ